MVLQIVAVLAVIGGLLMNGLVPNGPFGSHASKFDPIALARIFKVTEFRKAAFGYFGHMWELYAFWAFIPLVLEMYMEYHGYNLNTSFWSFMIVASGFIGCSVGGLVSLKTGSAKVAFTNLSISAMCCLLSPLIFFLPFPLFIGFYLVWGISVVGDSPQFSSLSAQTCPKDFVGTGLTIVNSIGFGITIFSIQLVGYFVTFLKPEYWLIVLVIGPVFGMTNILSLTRKRAYT
jgi:MFS family permease